MFESLVESRPGINGPTQLKSLSCFSIFYDEPSEFSFQNNLEFVPFLSFICYILLPKKSWIKMKHFFQFSNIHIQFLLNRVSELCGICSELTKNPITEAKNASYDHVPT